LPEVAGRADYAYRISPKVLERISERDRPDGLVSLVELPSWSPELTVLLTNRRTRLSHPLVFRGSRGMNLRVPVLDFDEPDAAMAWLRDRSFHTYLATVGPQAVPYHDVRFAGRTALVVGNERYGISRPWLTYGFPQVTVPMRGRADSLNVSVSASILLYEARSQLS
jgi:TrmH family RNA methyltransferase